jgi:hypothetical protein
MQCCRPVGCRPVGGGAVGVAGWNASAAGLDVPGEWFAGGLGTLLGPEETPVVGGFLWSASGLGRLMRSCVGVVAVVGWGVVVC